MSEEQNEYVASKEEVNTVMEFAKGLYNGLSGYGYYSNPYIQNQNLVGLNNAPQKPTYEKLLKALEEAPFDYKTLVGYSEFMEVFDNIYRKTLDYFTGLLSFDVHYYPSKRNITPEEMQSDEYKSDLARVEKFISTFDYKQEFRKVLKEVLRRETSYVWFRDSRTIDSPIDTEEDKIKRTEKYALQIMPQQYCMLTGYFDNSQLLYDFNMNYFLKGTVDINLFDPSFKKKFREVFGDGIQQYNPSAAIGTREGEFATWTQCDPTDGAYAFKLDASNFRQVPVFSGLMKSAFNNTLIEDLQKDKNIASAYALMMGEMRLIDNAKSGDKANQWAVTPQVVGQLISLITQSLTSNIKPVPLPTGENRLVQFQDYNISMVKNQLSTSSGQGASANSMIYSDSKMGQFELQQAIETDYALVSPMYYQFAQFLDFFVNRKLRKYKFNFSFTGLNRSFSKDRDFKQLVQLADKGMVMDESMWSATFGMKPYEFKRSLAMGHYGGITELLTPLININTAKSGEAGNPTKDNNDLQDSGATARDYK